MRTWAQKIAYAEYLRVHPNADIRATGHCQGVTRDIAGVPGYASSALDAALMVPNAHRFDLAHARPGMMGFSAYKDSAGHYKQYGHAYTLLENHYVYSTDLPVHGRLGKVPLSLITTKAGWNMPVLWFSDWTPFGLVGLKPIAPVVAAPPPYLGVIGFQAPGDNRYKAQILAIQKALNKAGYAVPMSGTYIQGKDTAMRAAIGGYQASHEAFAQDNVKPGVIGPHQWVSLMAIWAR
jgi:hypothetical protein